MNDVAQHYNARPNTGIAQRQNSPIFHMKGFNNWLKSIIISKYLKLARENTHKQRLNVLDLACGKGGDLMKWSKGNINSLTGIDIADQSINHARQRFSDRKFNFSANFYTLDCFSNPLSMVIPDDQVFEFISIQFALHYSFENEGKARMALRNVSHHLVRGGVFIGTIPNAYRIIKNVKTRQELSFGNSIYNIKFDQIDTTPRFGHKYDFFLADAIDTCPEYVINIVVLTELAKEYNLKLLSNTEFHQIFLQELQNPSSVDLLQRMNVLDSNGKISADEWEAIGLYTAFAFEKI